jgi:Uma2 family endonuclease
MVVSRNRLARIENYGEWHEQLGGVPLSRIAFHPPPGTATEADLIRHLEGDPKRLFELIDGTLVEKAIGMWESIIAASIIRILGTHVAAGNLGLVAGSDGPFRMLRGNVRYPDVAFIPWAALPQAKIPGEKIWSVVPAVAVEVLSESNTAEEIERKISELFALGVLAVWIIDPPTESAKNYSSTTGWKDVPPKGKLTAEKALPGYRLPLTQLFPKPPKRKKAK